eukprot:TRINITY_DN25371_c1_g2_i1.p1 TRINITY_DN25371_c1_g2~~TRINITY_DN25371_c1_g2_i1.p1  ORF type:complete len:435 (-),score=43.48 TRINITY_DN25371_c1_g2_i1:56-1360(-)
MAQTMPVTSARARPAVAGANMAAYHVIPEVGSASVPFTTVASDAAFGSWWPFDAMESDASGSSRRYSAAEQAAVARCLEAVRAQSAKRRGEGLSRWTFTLGVLNALFVAYSFGALRSYFWIIYFLEAMALFPIRWWRQWTARPLCQSLYWLDFCWVANFFGNIMLVLLVVDALLFDRTIFSTAMHTLIWRFSWGVSTGPLLLAAGALGNSLVFHDASNTVALFIHLFPSMLTYVLRWHRQEVLRDCPGIFLPEAAVNNVWTEIYVPAFTAYVAWWIVYTFWLLTCGLSSPKRGYDTVFHSTMQGAGGIAFAQAVLKHKTTQEVASMAESRTWPRQVALAYMFVHGFMVSAALLVSLPCYLSRSFHAFLMGLIVVRAVLNGASRYTHYLLKSYEDIICKELGLTEEDLHNMEIGGRQAVVSSESEDHDNDQPHTD